MPNEEVLKKGDLSRELCLVLHGACRLLEDEKVKRIVRDDVRMFFLPPFEEQLCTIPFGWVPLSILRPPSFFPHPVKISTR